MGEDDVQDDRASRPDVIEAAPQRWHQLVGIVDPFPDRIDDKRVLLRNVREGSIVDHIPVGDIDVTIDIPGIDDLPVGNPGVTVGINDEEEYRSALAEHARRRGRG